MNSPVRSELWCMSVLIHARKITEVLLLVCVRARVCVSNFIYNICIYSSLNYIIYIYIYIYKF